MTLPLPFKEIRTLSRFIPASNSDSGASGSGTFSLETECLVLSLFLGSSSIAFAFPLSTCSLVSLSTSLFTHIPSLFIVQNFTKMQFSTFFGGGCEPYTGLFRIFLKKICQKSWVFGLGLLD
jgi:hypothetical protein